ncbi:MAG: hypothetical protein Q9219_002903 [cf. Caloplaca sp. 3 TL-2023]
MKPNPTDPDPLLRFWNETGPWNSQRVGGDPRQAPANTRFAGFDDPMRRNFPTMHFGFRSPRSEVDSSTTGRYPMDSGYGGSRSLATPSARSDQLDQSHSAHSISGDVNEFHPFPEERYQDNTGRNAPSHRGQYSPMDGAGEISQQSNLSFELTCSFQNCGATSRNQSEYRKHMLRHEKPFKCDVVGCSKVDGFSTNNDLDRHKKSVHKIMPKNSTDRSFRCAARNCPKKEKIWPRLDNFRQHCIRIHPEEDCDDLVSMSELDPGFSMQANNFGDSSKLSTGDVGIGTEVDGMTNYVNPRITFAHPLNTLSYQPCSTLDSQEFQLKYTSNTSPVSPEMPETSANMTRYSPNLQHIDTGQLLKVPEPNNSRKGPVLPALQSSMEQRHASGICEGKNLHKKGPKSKPMASAKKAEQVSEALASEITKCINSCQGSSRDIQAAIKNRLLLTFNPELLRKRTAQTAAMDNETNQRKKRRIMCDQCSATTTRECDMRKHKKRHTRPYGCTFPGCWKELGSKNDWKRHENTQHYQIETWRCHEHSKSSHTGQCASIFYRREQFQGHLREEHGLEDDEYIREQCKRHRIGRNGQSAFWCGFCRRVVELRSKGLEAWEERFSHIDDFHYKKGESIHDWVPLDGNLPKGLMNREALAENERRDDHEDGSAGEDSQSDGEDANGESASSSPRPQSRNDGSGNKNRDKGQAGASKRVRNWYCVSRLLPVSKKDNGQARLTRGTFASVIVSKAPTESLSAPDASIAIMNGVVGASKNLV